MISIILGSDHRGVQLKDFLKKKLSALNFNVDDYGAYNEESIDYPDVAIKVAKSVSYGKNYFGILICNSGIGMSIAANRIKHIRAALCRSVEDAKLARLHNDANILVLGSTETSNIKAAKIVDTFLRTQFEGGRHVKRINKIDSF